MIYSSQKDVDYTEIMRNDTVDPSNRLLGKFFGHVNRVNEWTMEVLIKKGFYTE